VPKVSLKERLNLEEIYHQFLGLDPQQRILAAVGLAVVLLLLIIVPISCASSKLSKLEKTVIGHEKNMDDLMGKLKDYQSLQNRMKAIEGQWASRNNVSLSTTLENLSGQSGLDKNIDAIKEQPPTMSDKDILEERVASVRISRAPLAQAMDYLYKIESLPNAGIKIKKLQMKPRYDNRQLFDLSFEVSTYALKKGGNP
jgi:hypothetical protein